MFLRASMAENGYAGVNEASENLKNATIANNSVEEAEELKKKANDFFQAQDYEKAIEFYTAAIEKNDSVAAYYGNRSISYLRTECFGYALNDANKALELDKTYLKGDTVTLFNNQPKRFPESGFSDCLCYSFIF